MMVEKRLIMKQNDFLKGRSYALLFTVVFIFLSSFANAQIQGTRTLSGVVVNLNNEAAANVTVIVASTSGDLKTVTDEYGSFSLLVPREAFMVRIEGKYVTAQPRIFTAAEATENIRIEIRFVVPPVHESVVISASQLDPTIDRRNDTVYKDTLFARDDQIFHTLDAGISAGQHEGGGKSVEVRRFGFNLDHGGVSGGLKVLVDNVQQNQGTQGHGQGYLGQLKSLTPELVQDVNILNGPFSAEYGDFSGLGVVHIRLKESLPDRLTLRLQGGSFATLRTFAAYSPQLKSADALFAYEGSRSDGPFKNPLRYKRDNLTGSFTERLNDREALGFKFNAGRNDFFSSGQLPMDLIADGSLDRFGFLDPFNGGRVRTATFGTYYRKESTQGSIFKVDGFASRSLFDLYSNFTFFLNDAVNGDEIQQHDSRLQEGVNAQYLKPYHLFGQHALLSAGANFHANHINVGLNQTVERNPIAVVTKAHANVTNTAGYVQQSVEMLNGKLNLSGGLRYDYFHFDVDDKVTPSFSGTQGASRFQPKTTLAFRPSARFPTAFYFNYGRGISSQDARGVVQRPEAPKISTTDFYQLGTAHNFKRFSLTSDLFLIDRSNEQVYIPDDGSIEFKGPSRATGFEVKSSASLTKYVSFNGGVTKVMNAFYRGAFPRVYVDSAPHVVSDAGLTLSNWRGFSGSLRMRYTSSYRLDGLDRNIQASGLTVVDFSMAKRLRPWVDFNLSIDNLMDKRYFETQNYFASRLRPADDVIARIHATPGYPRTVTAGLTFRLFGK
jgi:outer membrane receptor protein involved in Fe transport